MTFTKIGINEIDKFNITQGDSRDGSRPKNKEIEKLYRSVQPATFQEKPAPYMNINEEKYFTDKTLSANDTQEEKPASIPKEEGNRSNRSLLNRSLVKRERLAPLTQRNSHSRNRNLHGLRKSSAITRTENINYFSTINRVEYPGKQLLTK